MADLKYKFEDPDQEIDLENLDYQVRFKTEPNFDQGTFSIEFDVTFATCFYFI